MDHRARGPSVLFVPPDRPIGHHVSAEAVEDRANRLNAEFLTLGQLAERVGRVRRRVRPQRLIGDEAAQAMGSTIGFRTETGGWSGDPDLCHGSSRYGVARNRYAKQRGDATMIQTVSSSLSDIGSAYPFTAAHSCTITLQNLLFAIPPSPIPESTTRAIGAAMRPSIWRQNDVFCLPYGLTRFLDCFIVICLSVLTYSER